MIVDVRVTMAVRGWVCFFGDNGCHGLGECYGDNTCEGVGECYYNDHGCQESMSVDFRVTMAGRGWVSVGGEC